MYFKNTQQRYKIKIKQFNLNISKQRLINNLLFVIGNRNSNCEVVSIAIHFFYPLTPFRKNNRNIYSIFIRL